MAYIIFLFTVTLAALHNGVMASAQDIPEECKDLNLCDVKPDFYDDLQSEINAKFLPIKNKWNLSNDNDDFEELPDSSFSELNCNMITKVIKPYTVRSNGTVMAVVQTNFYEQRFKTTQCVSSEDYTPKDGDQCFKELTTSSTKGQCTTKYTTIALYVFNTTHKKIQRIPVELPVCCHCSIARNYP